MSYRSSLVILIVSAVLFLSGLNQIVGQLPPDLSVLFVPSLIPLVGFLLSIVFWIRGLNDARVRHQRYWFVLMLVFVLVMPLVTLGYYVANPEIGSQPNPTPQS